MASIKQLLSLANVLRQPFILIQSSSMYRFIDDACKEGVPVVVLAAYSRSGENIARSII